MIHDPVPRCSRVVDLAVHLRQCRNLPRPLSVLEPPVEDVHVVSRVAVTRLALCDRGPGEPFLRVLAEQLVNTIGPPRRTAHKRLFHETPDLGQRGAGDEVRRLSPETTTEDRERLHQGLLADAHQAPRVVEDRAHAPLAHGHIRPPRTQEVDRLLSHF